MEDANLLVADQPTLQLNYQRPLAWTALTNFLATRGARNVEQCVDGYYRRTLASGGHKGWISVHADSQTHTLHAALSPGLAAAAPQIENQLRRLFDLDSDQAAIHAHLTKDPLLAPGVAEIPGLRVPGAVNGFELVLRAILGQQITVKAATTVFTRFADYFGEAIETPFDGLDRLAPRAETIANANLQEIIDRGLTQRRAQTVHTVAQAIASDSLQLDGRMSIPDARAALQALPGVGPWTAHYISMRALGDVDAFPEQDLGLLRALDIDQPKALRAMAEAWRPWRAYAAMYIWHHHGAGG